MRKGFVKKYPSLAPVWLVKPTRDRSLCRLLYWLANSLHSVSCQSDWSFHIGSFKTGWLIRSVCLRKLRIYLHCRHHFSPFCRVYDIFRSLSIIPSKTKNGGYHTSSRNCLGILSTRFYTQFMMGSMWTIFSFFCLFLFIFWSSLAIFFRRSYIFYKLSSK